MNQTRLIMWGLCQRGGCPHQAFYGASPLPEDFVYVRFPTVASMQGDATGAVTVIGMDAS
ncbi:hypothetical protein I6I10_07120 [Corynebacterium glucuronolyticum]|uniref:Uncharacterized protein n=1 Tax=Corynebacterium glucuronolyticum TaxID=39791 RepID=A0A7T4BN68_9CORY|nr:hypothetical protein [Corynebacterium glucuronolyticum]QQB45310.1 hypothetical protein I6I10_07120 [Corynebacterium glucuronolyticum]